MSMRRFAFGNRRAGRRRLTTRRLTSAFISVDLPTLGCHMIISRSGLTSSLRCGANFCARPDFRHIARLEARHRHHTLKHPVAHCGKPAIAWWRRIGGVGLVQQPRQGRFAQLVDHRLRLAAGMRASSTSNSPLPILAMVLAASLARRGRNGGKPLNTRWVILAK